MTWELNFCTTGWLVLLLFLPCLFSLKVNESQLSTNILICALFTGMSVRTVNRPEHQLLGANGRDDGALVSLLLLLFIR